MYDSPLFEKDAYTAFSSLEDGIFQIFQGTSGSVFAGLTKKLFSLRSRAIVSSLDSELYFDGLPSSVENFSLSNMIAGLINTLENLTQPSFVYFHFFTPHEPYKPLTKFFSNFQNDGYKPINKPVHPAVRDAKSNTQLEKSRLLYDSYIASWDEELAVLFKYFDRSGFKEKSHIFITSDHGETFERGLVGHGDVVLFEPLIKVPLIVSTPGQDSRIDIHTKTSNIDLLPTIAGLTGVEIPTWAEGKVLPGVGGIKDEVRKLFILDAKNNSAFTKLNKFTISFHSGQYKMIKYNYPRYSAIELYNLSEDPEELNDLYGQRSKISFEMEHELTSKIRAINTEYEEE